MALVQRSNTTRTIILATVLGVALIGGGIYLYLQNKPVSTTTDQDAVQATRQRPIVKDFSDGIFTDPRFTNLGTGTAPVIVQGNVGKPNPFAPTF